MIEKFYIYICIIIAFLLIILLAINVIGEIFYQYGLVYLPKEIDIIGQNNNITKFDKCVWIHFTNDKPLKMIPISISYYFSNLVFTPNNFLYEKSSFNIANIVSRIIYRKYEVGKELKSLEMHLINICFTVWVSRNITAKKCLKIISNETYFSKGYYGIVNAARGYFNKNPNELSINEISFLIIKMEIPTLDPNKNSESFNRKKQEIINTIINSENNILKL